VPAGHGTAAGRTLRLLARVAVELAQGRRLHVRQVGAVVLVPGAVVAVRTADEIRLWATTSGAFGAIAIGLFHQEIKRPKNDKQML
jgi:hypothetical protein